MGAKTDIKDPDVQFVPSEPDVADYVPEEPGFPPVPGMPVDYNPYPGVPEATKYDSVAPPSYAAMELQEFVITNGMSGMSLKAFASENALRLFKEYTKLSPKHQDFARAKENQNRAVGLPLLVTKRSFSMGLGDTSLLRFFECAPAPEAPDRLYDKVDNRPVGEVLRRKFIGYCRYRLQLKGVETVIMAHSRLPIVDLKIHNERFRFVKAIDPILNPDHFLYDLYLLTPDQTSLIDDMDSSLKVNKDNPLLGGSMRNLFAIKWGPYDRSKYVSAHKCGSFEYHSSWELFTSVKKCSMFSMYTYAAGEPDANTAVEFRTLILVAVTIILQRHEEELQGQRAATA